MSLTRKAAILVAVFAMSGDVVLAADPAREWRYELAQAGHEGRSDLIALLQSDERKEMRYKASYLLSLEGEVGDAAVIEDVLWSPVWTEREMVSLARHISRLDREKGVDIARRLLENLREPRARVEAMSMLADNGDTFPYIELIETLGDLDPSVRRGAVRVLGDLAETEVAEGLEPSPTDLLIRLAEDESEWIRWQAVVGLGSALRRGDADNHSVIRDVLCTRTAADSSEYVRRRAAFEVDQASILCVEVQRSTAVAQPKLSEGSHEVREKIAPARGDDEAWQYVGLLQQNGVSMEASAVAAAARSHDDSQVRWAALELLSRVKAEESRELFTEALREDQNRVVRETAAHALAKLGDLRGRRALEDFLSDAEPPRDLLIATQLAKLGDRGGYPILVDAVGSASRTRREEAARYLPYFMGARLVERCPGPEEVLERLLGDPDEGVRRAAVGQLNLAVLHGFSRARAKELAATLVERDSSAGVRETAALELRLLESHASEDEPCERL